MTPFSTKATISSVIDGVVTLDFEDGQHVTIHPQDTSKLSVGQNVWVTISDATFDPTQQPKEILNTIFGA